MILGVDRGGYRCSAGRSRVSYRYAGKHRRRQSALLRNQHITVCGVLIVEHCRPDIHALIKGNRIWRIEYVRVIRTDGFSDESFIPPSAARNGQVVVRRGLDGVLCRYRIDRELAVARALVLRCYLCSSTDCGAGSSQDDGLFRHGVRVTPINPRAVSCRAV